DAAFVVLAEQLITHIRMADRVQVKKAAVNLLKLAERILFGEAAEALEQGGRLRLRRTDQRGAFGGLACQSRGGIIQDVRDQPHTRRAARKQALCTLRKEAHGPLCGSMWKPVPTAPL